MQEMTRPARRRTPSSRRATRAAHEDYLRAPGRARRGARDRRASRPAACRPGSSACTCWPRTRSRRARGQPARRRGARAARRLVGAGARALRAAPRTAGADAGAAVSDRRDPRRAIDCGTNSIRLLSPTSTPRPGRSPTCVRRMEIVRLGQGVDRTGLIAPEAMERTARDGGGVRRTVPRSSGVERVRFVATSASRDAAQRRGVRRRGARRRSRDFGVEPEVVSGRRGGGAVVHRRDRRSCVARGVARPLPRRRPRRRLHRVRPGHRRASRRRGRSTSAACG